MCSSFAWTLCNTRTISISCDLLDLTMLASNRYSIFLFCMGALSFTLSTFIVLCPLGADSYFENSVALERCVSQGTNVGLSTREAYALCFPVHQADLQIAYITFFVVLLFISAVFFLGGMVTGLVRSIYITGGMVDRDGNVNHELPIMSDLAERLDHSSIALRDDIEQLNRLSAEAQDEINTHRTVFYVHGNGDYLHASNAERGSRPENISATSVPPSA